MSITADKIKVTAIAQFLPGQSDPDSDHYVFAYSIRIRNEGELAVQLLRRHWFVEYGDGESVEVEGEGVVGEQPVIEPGGSYEYTSGTVLPAESGSMHGTYRMQVQTDGAELEVPVPRFPLEAYPIVH
jgi:ApaG protein